MARRPREGFVVGNWVALATAERALREWEVYHSDPNPTNVPIYRLVPVTVAEVERQAARERRARARGKRKGDKR